MHGSERALAADERRCLRAAFLVCAVAEGALRRENRRAELSRSAAWRQFLAVDAHGDVHGLDFLGGGRAADALVVGRLRERRNAAAEYEGKDRRGQFKR